MTDELDPQTQQHIDDSADTIDDCDTSTSSDGGIDVCGIINMLLSLGDRKSGV